MNTKELRIGNLVFYRKEIYEIDAISKSHIYLTNGENLIKTTIECLRPIPLTEEILLNFGFEKTKENFSTYDLGNLSIYMPSIHYEKGRTYFNSWVIIEKSPETVHQLQNLYFALTGEELELKLN